MSHHTTSNTQSSWLEQGLVTLVILLLNLVSAAGLILLTLALLGTTIQISVDHLGVSCRISAWVLGGAGALLVVAPSVMAWMAKKR